MSSEPGTLGWVAAGGTPRDIGRALGRAGRAAVHRHLLGAPIWQRVTDPAHGARLARMTATVKARFPAIWAEIEGLAEGLGLPLAEVMAWNCRGDLLASVPDGCTTVMLPGETPVLAHNEDGLPFFRGAAFVADVTPAGAPGFRAFCYPGSIPGHTFAFTEAGLVQTVNNIRLTGIEAEVPRMVLGRAVIAARDIGAALDLLGAHPHSGGFHFALSHVADRRIVSVEFGGGEVSVAEVAVPSVHANHALHQPRGLAQQIVTASSRDRQARGAALLAGGERDPLAILRDTGGPGLPIRRDAADDPDDENTLATALFRVTEDGIEWSIHDRRAGAPSYEGKTA
jgi:hypothetical protein